MSTEHILIVDDDIGIRNILEAMLKDEYQVSLAENGESALQRLSQHPRPDLILLDVLMPDIDGFTICEELQSGPDDEKIPIIFISGNSSFENEVRGLELGAVDYITKPFHLSVVKHRVRTQLELLSHRNRLKELVATKTAQLSESLAEVKAKENHLKGLINLAPIGIGLLENGVITQANNTMAELIGCSKRELDGMKLEDYYRHPELYRQAFEQLGSQLPEDTMAAFEAEVIKSCGTSAYFSIRFSPLPDSIERSRVIFTVMDISDSKRYEAELEARVEKRTHALNEINQKMQREIQERKNSEKALIKSEIELETQRAILEEANVALKVLIRDADHERRGFEERIALNLQELVEPYLDKLRKSRIDDRQQNYLSIIEGNLKNIVSPLVRASISLSMKLTPAELQISNLIKQGKSSKEIADLLHLSQRTIDKHRSNIRKKIGIENSKVNLRSVLLSDKREGRDAVRS